MKSKIMRKALAVIMTFMMVMTAMPTVFAASVSGFADFPTGWSSDAVRAAVDNGLLNGRTPSTLEPTGNLTRAELAAIINRAFGATIEKDISQYTDVSKSQWYYHDIAKAVNMQTFSGDSNNLMRPDDNITREEVFAVVARALVLETSDYSAISAFGDGAYVSDWAKKYVSILASKKYINGNNYGNICPKDYITREEFAQMMHNIIKTYYTKQGTFIYTGADSSLIRTGEVTLSNVTIDGDLIIGDGVGRSNVYLNNVTIKGRLLCRGGEGQVKLTNTTVERGVVVKDVNGTVHFENYRDEAPFANIAEITPASFLSRTQNNISGGGSGSSKKTYVTYYTEHYLEDYDNEGTYVLDYSQKHTKIEKGNSVGPVEGKYTGYVLNKTLGDNPDTMAKAYEGLTFKLYYDIIRYYVKINLPDSSVKDITYKYGQKISDKFDLNSYGDYEFYYTNDKGEEVVVTDITLAGENIEIKCRALRSVTFDHNDTTGAKTTVKIGDGKKLSTLPTVTRDGYKLIGWNTAADGSGTDYNESSIINADITLYAQWAEIGVDYIVTFHKNDGLNNIFKKAIVRKNNTVDEPTPAPTRTNYNFTGWYTDAECTHKFDFATPITDNTELYAGWIKVKYSVIFNVDGAPYATADIEVGEKIGDANMPTAPSKAGYEFDGWFEGTTEITKDTVVNANITATAKYTKLHTVTFMADGAEFAKVTVRDNTAIGTKMPADPVKSGYTFDG
ncbi:MAG: InlB B-repeat-containing protein, partial [Clostridia bacterium]|nr:InlB B-repeat-containing protein [Clostridia bacterium]